MINRNYLKDSILLCGENDHGKFPVTFSIKEIISSSGASAVCYAARHDKSGIGVLKEFYPLEVHSLMRDENDQLIKKPGMEKENARFDALLKEYIEPYNMLLEARKQGDLATFIPPFEMYYGCDEKLNCIGTVYIWSPEPKLETFDKVCAEIHDHPAKDPEFNLVRVLYSIESLVKCIRALHNAGLIHRDIKPSNFGFIKRGDELLTQTISLFDIDTICSVYNIHAGVVRGSKGFMEPESISRSANNLTDIFAIGASLFNAIIVNDDVRKADYLYNDSFYPKLKEYVDSSELIQASEVNSHPHLRATLTKILQKTLCERDDRYQSCEELLADVQKALYYVVPAEISDRGNAGEQWILADLDKLRSLDANYERNSTLALQYHLYSNPLYMKCPAEKNTIDILVIGFGKYGQKFLDIALQIGQMPGKRLNVTVISDSAEDKAVYMAERPELAKFFNIDGSLPGDPESYGDVRFVEHTLSIDDSAGDLEFIRSLLPDGQAAFDYAFVAIGRDSRSLAAAKTAEQLCQTSLVLEGKHIAKDELKDLLPVYVSDDISTYPFLDELERMAFNVHLIWNKNLNINFSEVRKEFRKPYNHNSCISFVLAMKYKLYGIGIDILSGTPSEIAGKYLDYITTHEEQKNTLIYLEHRRWVAEKLCLGYTRITDLEECATGKMKDEKQKRHVCIVRSTPENTLSLPDWTIKGRINKRKWDMPTGKDLSMLDDLDRMSVELHCMHLKHANIEKKNNLLNGDTTAAIANYIERDPSCIIAFQELLTCMKDIWNNDSEQWKRYEGLRRVFVGSVKSSDLISERDRNSTLRLMDSLNEKFYPVLACQQYRDYKKDDVALVEGIPFILTYSDTLYMVIPYCSDDKSDNNTAVFSNLAAPTVVNPSKIIYVAYCKKNGDLADIRKKIPYMTNFMKKKEFRASVEFMIGYRSGLNIGDPDEIERDLKVLSNNRVVRVRMMEADTVNGFLSELKEYLLSRKKDKMNFLFEVNDTNLSGVMVGSNIFNEFSSYSYDSANMEFTVINDCDVVKYIQAKPFITVTDMFAFRLATSATSNKPEFYSDYNELWRMYRSNTGVWKFLCGLLREYSETNDMIAIFKDDGSCSGSAAEYQYILPFSCKKNAAKIIDALVSVKIIDEQSNIITWTTNSCKVMIKDLCGHKKAYDDLFSRIVTFQTDSLHCNVDNKNRLVKIMYDNLAVRNLNCSKMAGSGYDLLDFFHRKGYLIDLSYDRIAEKASFTFATPQIKDLLTLEGRMLEIYVYHKAQETGKFDDIRSSFEIDWEKSLASNEFDCILTKGFSTLFIECKATRDIKTEYYNKLKFLAREFGINATAVLIADTQDNMYTAPVNERQREHGKQVEIITISNRADIENIGFKLLKLIENK